MRIGVQEVSPSYIQKMAENNFREGFYCSEALMKAIQDGFNLDAPDEVIAMSTGMALGLGGSGCLCAALNAGVMALGMFFGRTEKSGPHDPTSRHILKLTNELFEQFKKDTGKFSVCCRVLTKEYDMKKGENLEQCIHLTGMAAKRVSEIIARELNLKNLDEAGAEETKPRETLGGLLSTFPELD